MSFSSLEASSSEDYDLEVLKADIGELNKSISRNLERCRKLRGDISEIKNMFDELEFKTIKSEIIAVNLEFETEKFQRSFLEETRTLRTEIRRLIVYRNTTAFLSLN